MPWSENRPSLGTFEPEAPAGRNDGDEFLGVFTDLPVDAEATAIPDVDRDPIFPGDGGTIVRFENTVTSPRRDGELLVNVGTPCTLHRDSYPLALVRVVAEEELHRTIETLTRPGGSLTFPLRTRAEVGG